MEKLWCKELQPFVFGQHELLLSWPYYEKMSAASPHSVALSLWLREVSVLPHEDKQPPASSSHLMYLEHALKYNRTQIKAPPFNFKINKIKCGTYFGSPLFHLLLHVIDTFLGTGEHLVELLDLFTSDCFFSPSSLPPLLLLAL